MALCIRKRARVDDEDIDIFERQGDMLDELVSGKLLEADCLEELVCSEDNLHRAGETDTDDCETDGRDDQSGPSGKDKGRAGIPKDGSAGRLAKSDSSDEDMFQGDLISCYLQEISRFPLLSPEREVELAKTIKEGQDSLVALIWDERAADSKFDGLRQKLRKWQKESANYPGLREKMVEHALAALKRVATHEDASEDYHQLLAEALEIAEKIDVAKNEMVEGNLRLVLSIAKRHRGRGLSFLDLIQEGNMGLLKAVSRYDYTKGNRFSTYATWWVRQSIIRGIYDKTRTIRLPVHFIEMKSYFFKIFYELVKELGREPTPMEIAEHSGLSLEKVMMIIQLSSRPISLEAPLGSEEQRLGDFIADDTAVSPLEDATLKKELERLVEAEVLTREEVLSDPRYSFKQALIQDAAYHSLLKRTIQQYHQKICVHLNNKPSIISSDLNISQSSEHFKK